MENLVIPGAALGAVGVLLALSIIVFRFMVVSYREERRLSRENFESEKKQWAADRLVLQAQISHQDKLHREERGRLEDRVSIQERHTERCERRLNTIVIAAHEFGMPIPPEVWSD